MQVDNDGTSVQHCPCDADLFCCFLLQIALSIPFVKKIPRLKATIYFSATGFSSGLLTPNIGFSSSDHDLVAVDAGVPVNGVRIQLVEDNRREPPSSEPKMEDVVSVSVSSGRRVPKLRGEDNVHAANAPRKSMMHALNAFKAIEESPLQFRLAGKCWLKEESMPYEK